MLKPGELEKINISLGERMKHYPDSRAVSEEDVTIAMLLTEIKELTVEIEVLKGTRKKTTKLDKTPTFY